MDRSDTAVEKGLMFFGTVTASISHDIKNRMAIINEQAGLLEDFVRMAGKGRELEPGRLMRLADSIRTQIAMSDVIIKYMNQFAHSVDVLWGSADLGELLSLTEGLAKRTAENREVRLDIRFPEQPVTVHTSPFYLMNLIWLCLDELMLFPGKDKSVALGCEKAAEGGSVWMTAGWIESDMGKMKMSMAIKALAKQLNAQIRIDGKEKRIIMRLSRDSTPVEPSV